MRTNTKTDTVSPTSLMRSGAYIPTVRQIVPVTNVPDSLENQETHNKYKETLLLMGAITFWNSALSQWELAIYNIINTSNNLKS